MLHCRMWQCHVLQYPSAAIDLAAFTWVLPDLLHVFQWVNHTPEGSFPVVCNGDRYAEMVRTQGGEAALQQWKALEEKMRPLQQGAALFPAAALRSDPGTFHHSCLPCLHQRAMCSIFIFQICVS